MTIVLPKTLKMKPAYNTQDSIGERPLNDIIFGSVQSVE
jgi:hypothetical protein